MLMMERVKVRSRYVGGPPPYISSPQPRGFGLVLSLPKPGFTLTAPPPVLSHSSGSAIQHMENTKQRPAALRLDLNVKAQERERERG